MNDDETGNELVLADDQPQEQSNVLDDMRSRAMSVAPEQMEVGLAEYKLRRQTFRAWLNQQLVEGVHYGYPPRCAPDTRVDPKQWTAKPSLYQAGADFVSDLMDIRPVFSPDLEGWKMGGSLPSNYVIRCQLVSKSTGAIVGEGMGSCKAGSKHDDNGALKMAMKRAKVSAVLNAYGLSDLFTQDMEDPADKPEHDTPKQKPDATKTQPRGKRVSPDQLKAVCVRYRTWMANDTGEAPTPEALAEYATKHTGVQFAYDTVLKADNWTQDTLKKFSDEVAKHEPPEGI